MQNRLTCKTRKKSKVDPLKYHKTYVAKTVDHLLQNTLSY